MEALEVSFSDACIRTNALEVRTVNGSDTVDHLFQAIKASHHLGVMDVAASRMNALTDALLDLSRTTRHPLRVEDVDLAELATSGQVELTAEQRARSLGWWVEPLPLLSANWHVLCQVMVNLLSNAVKDTRTRVQAVIEVRARERPGKGAVLVRDNGVGFGPRSTWAGCSGSFSARTTSASSRAPE